VIAAIRQAGAKAHSEAALLEEASCLIAGFIGADRLAVAEALEVWAEAVVPMRFLRGDEVFLSLGRRRGGRLYLSEDQTELARLAAVAVEQVERLRNTEAERLVSQAELRALQSQINPHFLFNALNTLYGTIPREAAEARRMTLNLAEVFRYFLQSERTFIPLAEEMRIVRAYLEIEALRLGDRLHVEIAIDPAAELAQIPVLSIQPLVENAVKHGVASRTAGGTVRLTARKTAEGVRVEVSDDGAGFSAGPRTGVGLENVHQRLKLCFGDQAGLTIESTGQGSTVGFIVYNSIQHEHNLAT
jgi:LytS/YehU family sensor histidine kinase